MMLRVLAFAREPVTLGELQRKVYVVARERAVWLAFIRREPRVGVLIDDEAKRHRRVQMTATAAVVEGSTRRADRGERWRQLGLLLSARYMADERGQAYAELTAERPRFLVEITPAADHVLAGWPMASALLPA